MAGVKYWVGVGGEIKPKLEFKSIAKKTGGCSAGE